MANARRASFDFSLCALAPLRLCVEKRERVLVSPDYEPVGFLSKSYRNVGLSPACRMRLSAPGFFLFSHGHKKMGPERRALFHPPSSPRIFFMASPRYPKSLHFLLLFASRFNEGEPPLCKTPNPFQRFFPRMPARAPTCHLPSPGLDWHASCANYLPNPRMWIFRQSWKTRVFRTSRTAPSRRKGIKPS